MNRKTYPALGEQVLWQTLSNGLPVAVIPRPGFTRKLAYFVADYGAIHTAYSADGQALEAPAGVAHYLEHKLFDMPGRDITAEFAALGANPNAFTSYDMTAYHFSCTENFPACLRLLLEFVSTPYFTEQSVAKEQGIIGQEIDMNEDAPETRIFELLMQTMYENHPIRVPILGTRQTISQITPQILEACHRSFYHPENMLLCVVGDVQLEQVCAIAEEALPPTCGSKGIPCRAWQEEMTCASHFVSDHMEVAMPMFLLGFKCEPLGNGRDAIFQEIVGDLAAEALFGESSRLYMQLYEEGVIDSSFGGGFETVEGMALLSISGDSDTPERVREAVFQHAEQLLREGISEEALLRMKRSAMGRRIRGLDSFDSVCFRVCAYHLSGFDYFEFPALYEAVTADHILQFLRRVITRQRACLCVIYPNKEDTL